MGSFPDSVFVVASHPDLILFDTKADRYLALPASLGCGNDGEIDIGLDGATLLPEAATTLLEAGLLCTDTKPRITRFLDKPHLQRGANPAPELRCTVTDAVRLIGAVVATGLKIRHGLSCRHFIQARDTQREILSLELEMALARLRATRLIVPTPRRFAAPFNPQVQCGRSIRPEPRLI